VKATRTAAVDRLTAVRGQGRDRELASRIGLRARWRAIATAGEGGTGLARSETWPVRADLPATNSVSWSPVA
jgi:hypothetical protein